MCHVHHGLFSEIFLEILCNLTKDREIKRHKEKRVINNLNVLDADQTDQMPMADFLK